MIITEKVCPVCGYRHLFPSLAESRVCPFCSVRLVDNSYEITYATNTTESEG